VTTDPLTLSKKKNTKQTNKLSHRIKISSPTQLPIPQRRTSPRRQPAAASTSPAVTTSKFPPVAATPHFPLPAWSRLRCAHLFSLRVQARAGSGRRSRCYYAAVLFPTKSRPVLRARRFTRAACRGARSAPGSREGAKRASSTASGRRFSSPRTSLCAPNPTGMMATGTLRIKSRERICLVPRRRRCRTPGRSRSGCVSAGARSTSGERTRLPCGRSAAWGCSCPTI
jgi:hypothetical protein